jgi:AcrR family transcriptional regulator
MQFVQFCTLWITQTKTPKRLATLIKPSVVGRTSGISKRGYHHGNLKQALINVALTLIEAEGPTGFTLSEASKTAGVTPAAVYHHFDGREDLVAEAARQGYDMFADLMEFAYQSGHPSAMAAFRATGRAYLAFAQKYPGHYIAMFESSISVNRTPGLAAASKRANDVLEKAVANLSKHIQVEKRPPTSLFSAHMRAMSHGVVELFTRNLPGRAFPFSPEDLLETGIRIYLRGLGLIDADD